ncbi:Amidase protein [Rutstroemia sp. NJR-2017a BVV2]|nr:Amidase protein [Rutstroemia sp. NJR-2017a BVV2]
MDVLELYPPAKSTAPSLDNIIGNGAWMLGKTKLSSFLLRVKPSESVDFQTAWNPRGDGYQGHEVAVVVAAATAAYDCVDIAIGTDKNGSIRRPAQCNGLFGLRPSRESFRWKAFSPSSRIFSRNLGKLSVFAETWYGEGKSRMKQKNLPMAIVVPVDLFPSEDSLSKQLVPKLIEDLENHLEVEAQRIGMSEIWKQQPPQAAAGESLHENAHFDRHVGWREYIPDENYHSTAGFRDDYLKKFDRSPFSSPFVTWKFGKQYTAEQHEEGMWRMNLHEEWFLQTVMQVDTANTLVVVQSENAKPNYRDGPPPWDAYYIQSAWHQWWISPILGAPEIIIPVRQIRYESRISSQTEYLPVTASIMGPPDMDVTLIGVTKFLMKDTGWPLVANSGKTSRFTLFDTSLLLTAGQGILSDINPR